ncbi:MAG: DNA/RNA non-specific endonuclease [Alphaproteobacteria bacterium]|nr:DNA/RNA non-specific endonuclease [Alphaproteobacteria bacterium]
MDHESTLEAIARRRIEQTEQEIQETIDCVRFGIPRAAESDLERREASIRRNSRVAAPLASQFTRDMETEGLKAPGAEALRGPTIDFVPVSYMERGLSVARSVARVAFPDRRPQGTGFLCSNRLFVTNHHVIRSVEDAKIFNAEFNYEIGMDGVERPATIFKLAPETFFFTDDIDGLDVTVVAVGERVRGDQPVDAFGWCGLSASATKHALGDFVTIIQHPRGRHKEVVLRENVIAGRNDVALHYVTDTEGGSSGSPVFNSDWNPVALHHWGGVHAWQGSGAYQPNTVNEGIRISVIVDALRAALPNLPPAARVLLEDALTNGDQGFPAEALSGIPAAAAPNSPVSAARPNGQGGVTWTVPLEVTVNLPGSPAFGTDQGSVASAAPSGAGESADDLSDRPGYRPDFIEGELVPLPEMSATQISNAAVIRPERRVAGQSAIELRYQHFSIVMNGARRLAYFTACNIHGESLIGYSRSGDSFYDYTAASTAFRESMEGAEADSWADDTRIGADALTGALYYKSTPNRLVDAKGHEDLDPTPNFDRGHLVRRLDPCWGTRDKALLAERDSFFWTNAVPQTSRFNQGKAKGLLGQKEGRLWQGVENYLLRNAWAMDTRVTVFTGPVFADDDPVYSDKSGSIALQVPLKFWKVLVWKEDGELKSLALVADQLKTMKKKPEDAEALADADQLDLMENFLTTVAKVEKLTGFEFGPAVSKADIRFGQRDHTADAPEALAKVHGPTSRKSRKR